MTSAAASGTLNVRPRRRAGRLTSSSSSGATSTRPAAWSSTSPPSNPTGGPRMSPDDLRRRIERLEAGGRGCEPPALTLDPELAGVVLSAALVAAEAHPREGQGRWQFGD